jgi:hypothetical protein
VYEAMLISGSPISESLNAGKNSEINSREIITKRNDRAYWKRVTASQVSLYPYVIFFNSLLVWKFNKLTCSVLDTNQIFILLNSKLIPSLNIGLFHTRSGNMLFLWLPI